MEPRSLEDWMALAATDPLAWQSILGQRLQHCVQSTRSRVLCDYRPPPRPQQEGPLAGVPFVAKDLFDWQGTPTRGGSVLPELARREATQHAELVDHFQSLGAGCCGKTQLNEFAYGLSGENPHYGHCRHPHHPARLSGGSSSGSAWMVARRIVPLALGTDTGGSIRVPAAWCGIYGIRWQPGLWLGGCYPLASGFDTAGWFTASAEDMAITLQSTFPTVATGKTPAVSGVACFPADSVSSDIREALTGAIAPLGLTHDHRLLPWLLLQQAAHAFNVLQSRQAYEHHRTQLEQTGHLYDPAVRRRLLRGKSWSKSEVAEAGALQNKLSRWLEGYFQDYNLLCLPACPEPAPLIRGATPELREKTLALTSLASLTGKPVLTLPVCLNSGLSVGVQCIFAHADPALPLEICRLG